MGVRFGKELYGNPPTSSPRSLPARVQAPRPRASPFQAGNPPVWGGGEAFGLLGSQAGSGLPKEGPSVFPAAAYVCSRRGKRLDCQRL